MFFLTVHDHKFDDPQCCGLTLFFMEKFTFNAEGLEQLLRELYGLSDDALNEQANAIHGDFTGWMADHFILESTQLNYLQKLDPQFVAFASGRCRDYLKKRWPISLNKAEKQANLARVAQDKVVVVHEDTKGKYAETTGFTETGELHIQIQYQ